MDHNVVDSAVLQGTGHVLLLLYQNKSGTQSKIFSNYRHDQHINLCRDSCQRSSSVDMKLHRTNPVSKYFLSRMEIICIQLFVL